MTNFMITKHTEGYLITQEFGKDVEKEIWYTRKLLRFTEEHVVVDPNVYRSFQSVYPKGTMANELAADGYYVFSHTKDAEAKHLFAVHESLISIE